MADAPASARALGSLPLACRIRSDGTADGGSPCRPSSGQGPPCRHPRADLPGSLPSSGRFCCRFCCFRGCSQAVLLHGRRTCPRMERQPPRWWPLTFWMPSKRAFLATWRFSLKATLPTWWSSPTPPSLSTRPSTPIVPRPSSCRPCAALGQPWLRASSPSANVSPLPVLTTWLAGYAAWAHAAFGSGRKRVFSSRTGSLGACRIGPCTGVGGMHGASVPGWLIPKEPRSVAPMPKVPMSWVPMPLAPMSRAPRLRVPLFRWVLRLLVPAASRPIRAAMRGPRDTPSRSSGATRVCPPEPLRRARGARPGGGPGQGVPQRGDPRQRGMRPGAKQQSDPQ